MLVYHEAVKYLEKWYDYEGSIFSKLIHLNLNSKLDYEKVFELII